jgi:hypothetical protein
VNAEQRPDGDIATAWCIALGWKFRPPFVAAPVGMRIAAWFARVAAHALN